MTARVDIRVPTLGVRPYVVEAVRSVLAQTFTGWRLVVQENGPGDPAVLDLLAPLLEDERVTHEATGEVLPIYDNWTRAIQAGTAPYVVLLHDDDVLDPGWLERRVAFLDAHPDATLVCGGHREIDAEGAPRVVRPLPLPGGLHPPARSVPALYTSNFIAPPTVMVRRTAYEAVGNRFAPDLEHFIDHDMWLRLALEGPIGVVAEHDAGSRVHGGSLTTARPPMGELYLRFTAYMERLIAERRPDLRLDEGLRRHKRRYAHVIAALDALEAGDRRRGLRHLRAALRADRRALLDPRIPVALVAAAGGPRAVRAMSRLRAFVARHELRLHLRDRPI